MSHSLYACQSVAQTRFTSAGHVNQGNRPHTRALWLSMHTYQCIHVVLQREGWQDNVKRVYRLYHSECLSLRFKRPKRDESARLHQPRHLVTAMNQIWSIDFVADALFDGRRLHALTVVDNFTRESLAIDVGQSLKGEDVLNTLNRIAAQRGLPATIKVDNGSEFISKVMDKWAYDRGVELNFSRPGKPTDNAKVESFNGRLRQQCLNAHWFLSLEDVRSKTESLRQYYNEVRPRSALQWSTPTEFDHQARETPPFEHINGVGHFHFRSVLIPGAGQFSSNESDSP